MWGIILLSSVIVVCVNSVERGTIIPLYIYPTNSDGSDAWKPLKDAHAEYPIEVWAIINVNSGPGSIKDNSYVSAISTLKSLGINTLGYVSTLYGQRASTAVASDMNKWKNWYAPNGIFLDEMTNDDTAQHKNYYANLDIYAKSQNFTFTVGNPGTDVPLGYFESVDTVMIFERDFYPSDAAVCNPGYDGVSGDEKEALAIFPYNIPILNETAILYAKNCLGYIYVTDDNGSNPWDTLPSYLPELFEILSR